MLSSIRRADTFGGVRCTKLKRVTWGHLLKKKNYCENNGNVNSLKLLPAQSKHITEENRKQKTKKLSPSNFCHYPYLLCGHFILVNFFRVHFFMQLVKVRPFQQISKSMPLSNLNWITVSTLFWSQPALPPVGPKSCRLRPNWSSSEGAQNSNSGLHSLAPCTFKS